MEMWKESQLTQLSYTKEIDVAYKISLNFIKNLGFKFCSFSITSKTLGTHDYTLSRNNFPHDWNTQYEQNKFSAIDPIVAHCNHSMLPILWTEDVYSKTPWLWQALQQQGLQYGWSQSIHDEDNGLYSMLSLARSHCPITAYELYENLGFTVFISRHLHALATQTLTKKAPKPSMPHLSPREVEVLKLSADGKTAYEISRILSLSERTVNFHVHSAIQKLGVCNKIAAVIAAARAGAI
ncbi:autoinducer binding domain-containing protein [Pseudomonas sp. 10S4]|uniref:autoinducer binding domain-containing protein n=1 Tax=Pseudomonas sp. 10S4 TaxID=3048583 RepID=UPI002AC96907|nr:MULTISPECIES: autoinducer binding domain-containing protein [unclassified Pseudomonas]MEB0225101.1 autoinducer binding domain-containing protein [Pseudomonas sp. 5S1]MEB0293381.1 autoinducer binding domain-containing protein [Pseudomonas sp. 10S4]WPX19229.1 autoinducer binding domain-containing protein [Pseudomonas sp. 10S4]